MNYRLFISLTGLFLLVLSGCKPDKYSELKLTQNFKGQYGQIEIGGKYAGLEFHHSRPLPSRISFYYPVANSIDLSTDYWQRDRSHPYTLIINYQDKTDSIAMQSCDYSYTPYQARFEIVDSVYRMQIKYDFCDDLPVIVVQFKLQNITARKTEFSFILDLKTILRTCHTYTVRLPANIEWGTDQRCALARFESIDTDSSLLIVINQVEVNDPAAGWEKIYSTDSIPAIRFHFTKELAPDQEFTFGQLIGSCKRAEADSLIPLIQKRYQRSIEQNLEKMTAYVNGPSELHLRDSTLLESYFWSKAVMAANRHYLNGSVVPMPCPAEYNFFFTHDVLLTDLAAVNFDIDRVRHDLLYLLSLSKADSILPHAYYFKDGLYQTEYCASDNWNHLWFLILAGTYYQHSADLATIKQIYPLLKKSIELMMQNNRNDHLMYAYRPDWWDIGHVYGARSYLTILMIQALRTYVQTSLILEQDRDRLLNYLQLADQMQNSLVVRLWDKQRGFLFNMLDTASVDTHYYAGSLLGAAFRILDDTSSKRLLQTARQKLLDPNIGIRIAMPADFHQLVNVYKFNDLEMGRPYIYLNGGCWPHGTAWYILGLIQTGQIEDAQQALKKYLTLDGITRSPRGQPSFYEYRNTDPGSQQYGEIDKPTFLWAGGWYLYTLYSLLGVREDPGNIYFHPEIPAAGGEQIEYDLNVFGLRARIHWQGSGKYFERILFNGQQVPASVLYKPVQDIRLIRGKPQQPYLCKSNVMIGSISFDQDLKVLNMTLNGIAGQRVQLEIVSPQHLDSIMLDRFRINDSVSVRNDNDIQIYKVVFTLVNQQSVLNCMFR
jgi:hypothetical protein